MITRTVPMEPGQIWQVKVGINVEVIIMFGGQEVADLRTSGPLERLAPGDMFTVLDSPVKMGSLRYNYGIAKDQTVYSPDDEYLAVKTLTGSGCVGAWFVRDSVNMSYIYWIQGFVRLLDDGRN